MEEIKYNRVQVILVEFGVDQLQLAENLNVNRNSVSRWCRNVVQPSLYQLREIAEFFGIDIRQLIEPTLWSDRKGPAPVELFKAQQKKTKEKKSVAVKGSRKSSKTSKRK